MHQNLSLRQQVRFTHPTLYQVRFTHPDMLGPQLNCRPNIGVSTCYACYANRTETGYGMIKGA
jgi:hypothetical protein